jgi:signal transduction histidine kinase
VATERERIFERFYRGQTSGRRGSTDGTGLGLSLVAEHVRLHGGRVWVESGVGDENRFVVELPAENVDAVATALPVRHKVDRSPPAEPLPDVS